MDYTVLEKSTLFQGVPANDLRAYLEETPHRVQRYEKEETVFHLMDQALWVGIILEGRVEAQKSSRMSFALPSTISMAPS